ncbi:MAG: RHS repeat-associated core domain-containing protein [Polyangiaceae bacterium]
MLGRLTRAQLIVPGTGEVTENILERDEHGRVLSESQQGRRISYVRDAYGRVVERILPTGSRTRYAYDATGELKHLEHDGYALDFEHDVAGRETARKTRAGLSLEHNYDALDRLVERRVAVDPNAAMRALGAPATSATRLASQRRWHYDANGRVTQMDVALWGSTSYRYDPAGRLLEAKGHQLHEIFSHDLADEITGFITQLNPNQGGIATEERAVYGDGGRLLRKGNTEYHYDRKGRRVGKVRTLSDGTQQGTFYDWDTRDRLRKLTRSTGFSIEYEYDAFGRRIKKTKYDPQRTAPVTTLYTWDGEVLAAEIDTEQGPRTFVHEPGTFEPVLQQQNGEVFLCVNDHLGMPKDLVAGDGAIAWSATHSAYGRVVATYVDETARARYGTAINSPFRLLGQVADDDAELCFTRYRCFDPEIGSWISSDPLEVEGGLNLYGFDGAPTDVVNPLGLAGNKHDKASAGTGLRPEPGYLRGKRHGIQQQPGDATRIAREEGKPHGVWGDKADLAHAGEQASTLSPRQMADFPIRPGSKSVVYNPDGTTSVPDMIRVRNNGDGTFHGFPINSTTAGPIVQ